MRRVIYFLSILVALLAAAPAKAATTRANYWPIRQFLAADSVIAKYYGQFMNYYGGNYPSGAAAFSSFCKLLRTSDLLADRLNMIGIPAHDVHTILRDLEKARFSASETAKARENIMAIDLALETIEGSITQNHRAEFRREVLAEIPPLTSTG